jgi:hypothetical protein
MTDELACDELVELVTDYLEDRLPAWQHRRFAEHLRECEGCERYVEQIRITVRLAAAEGVRASPPGIEALLPLFRAWRNVLGQDPPTCIK